MAVYYKLYQYGTHGSSFGKWYNTKPDIKGRQMIVEHAINPNPKNPRTTAQMTQRAKFANAVKFYKRAMANFFRFAYEDKKPNESDYNAFMRHNVETSLILSRTRIAEDAFPALGNAWMLSQGSLAVGLPAVTFDGQADGFNLGIPYGDGTIGSFSNSLIESYGCERGDIVTIILVVTDYSNYFLGDSRTTRHVPYWTTYQFIVNPDDNRDVTEMPNRSSGDKSKNTWGKWDDNLILWNTDDELAQFCGFIITRRKGAKLKATTSFLVGNTAAEELIKKMSSDSVVSSALEQWQVSEEAILQGTVAGATTTSTGPTITRVGSSTVPLTDNTVPLDTDKSLVIGGYYLDEYTAANFSGTNCTIKSYSASSANQATLTIHTNAFGTAGYTQWQVRCDGTLIAQGAPYSA